MGFSLFSMACFAHLRMQFAPELYYPPPRLHTPSCWTHQHMKPTSSYFSQRLTFETIFFHLFFIYSIQSLHWGFSLHTLFITRYPPLVTTCGKPICSKLHHLLLSAITQLKLTLHPHTHALPAPSLPSPPPPQTWVRWYLQMTSALILTCLLYRTDRFCHTDAAVGIKVLVVTAEGTWYRLHCPNLVKPVHVVQFSNKTLWIICRCYLRQVCFPCLVCLMLWAAAVCLTVAGYEDVGQASGSGDFCKGGYGTAVAAAASAQNKPASSVTGPGVGECRHMPN